MKKLAWLFLLLPAIVIARDKVAHVAVAGRDVAFWKPSGPAPAAGHPLIVFSHGYTGCNTQSVFLMEALAQAGYFVVAPNHKDARCGTARGTWYPGKMLANRPQAPFRDVDKWSEETYKDRREDIEAVLDGMLRDGSFQGVPIDRNRIGIAGHSLGGYTALAIAGGTPSWKDRRIKAVLALSPHCSPFVAKGDLPHLNVPVMYQGGTRDFGETPVVKRAGGAYDLSSSPKYYVELNGAGHFAWTDLNKSHQEVIDSYSIGFFDQYLKQQTESDGLSTLMQKPPKQVSAIKSDGR